MLQTPLSSQRRYRQRSICWQMRQAAPAHTLALTVWIQSARYKSYLQESGSESPKYCILLLLFSYPPELDGKTLLQTSCPFIWLGVFLSLITHSYSLFLLTLQSIHSIVISLQDGYRVPGFLFAAP